MFEPWLLQRERFQLKIYVFTLFYHIPFGRGEALSIELLWEPHTSSEVALQQSHTLESVLDLIAGKESGLAVAEISL